MAFHPLPLPCLSSVWYQGEGILYTRPRRMRTCCRCRHVRRHRRAHSLDILPSEDPSIKPQYATAVKIATIKILARSRHIAISRNPDEVTFRSAFAFSQACSVKIAKESGAPEYQSQTKQIEGGGLSGRPPRRGDSEPFSTILQPPWEFRMRKPQAKIVTKTRPSPNLGRPKYG